MSISSLSKRLVPCLHPVRVVNPHTQEPIMVGCGKCYNCLNTKASVAKTACDNEAKHHKYCFFVTVSYTEENLPLVKVLDAYDDHGEPLYDWINEDIQYLIYDDCKRSHTYGQLVGKISDTDYDTVLKRRYNPYKDYQSPIAFANAKDLQNYIKRVRDHVYRRTRERIRYFAVSDYGGKYLRPHFHILFFFDEQETFQIFREISISCWKYGNVDSSLSQGKSNSYVSSYVTGASCGLALYQTRLFKVRSFHSVRFGIMALQKYRDEIYELSTFPFDGTCYALPYGLAEFYGTSTVERLFFPRIYGFRESSDSEIFALYTLYYNVTHGQPSTYKKFRSEFQIYLDSLPEYELTRLRSALNILPNPLVSDDEYSPMGEKFESRLQSVYYVGKHFHRFVCSGLSYLHRIMFNKIKRYYDLYDSLRFRKFYESLEAESAELVDDARFFYPYTYLNNEADFQEYLSDLFDSDSYQRSKIEGFDMFNSRIKHKEISDILTQGSI